MYAKTLLWPSICILRWNRAPFLIDSCKVLPIMSNIVNCAPPRGAFRSKESNVLKQPTVSRRQFLQTLAALGGAAALTGCGSDGAGSSAGTLTIGISDEPEGLDIQQIGWDNYVHWLL